MFEAAQEFVQSSSWWQLYLLGYVLILVSYFIITYILPEGQNIFNRDSSDEDTLFTYMIFIFFFWWISPFAGYLSEQGENESEDEHRIQNKADRRLSGISTVLMGSVAFLFFFNIDRTPEERIARAEQEFQAEKSAIEEAHIQEIIEAQTQIKLAEIEAKRLKLYKESSELKAHSDKLAQLRSDLNEIKDRGADYSKLSRPTMSVGSTSQSPSESVDEQTKLILSGLWLGACFFIQRLFEDLFEDKGHALLSVFALGFLISFFTANYFLLGGSVTGGIMGSIGNRG